MAEEKAPIVGTAGQGETGCCAFPWHGIFAMAVTAVSTFMVAGGLAGMAAPLAGEDADVIEYFYMFNIGAICLAFWVFLIGDVPHRRPGRHTACASLHVLVALLTVCVPSGMLCVACRLAEVRPGQLHPREPLLQGQPCVQQRTRQLHEARCEANHPRPRLPPCARRP